MPFKLIQRKPIRITALLSFLILYLDVSLFAQENYIFIGGYYSKGKPEEICNYFQSQYFITNAEAERVTDSILNPIGLPRNFVLVPCPKIGNAIAVTPNDGIRYIVYDNAFIESIEKNLTKWVGFSILAHEIGHHLCGHSINRCDHSTDKTPISLADQRNRELEADEFSGFILYKLGATLEQAQAAINKIVSDSDDTYRTHPKKSRRMEAIKKGYDKAKNQEKFKNIIQSEKSPEEYYNEANDFYYQEEYFEANESYTSVVTLLPKSFIAWDHKGITLTRLERYEEAIKCYDKAIKIKPDNEIAWEGKGIILKGLKRYEEAIKCYNKAIEINPENATTWYCITLYYAELKNKNEMLKALKKAIELDNQFKEKAKKHEDFKEYWDDPDFKKLTE